MVDRLSSSYKNAYRTVLEEVSPELKVRIENGIILRKDIAEIAKCVVVRKHKDGSVSARKILSRDSKKFEISDDQLDLIKKVCSSQNDKETLVPIVRRNRRNSECKANSRSTHEEFFLNRETGLPADIAKLTLEYLPEMSHKIIALVNRDQKIPDYLKNIAKHLDLCGVRWDNETFEYVVKTFKNLESLTLPEEANNEWLRIISDELPNLKSLRITQCKSIDSNGLAHISDKVKSLKTFDLASLPFMGAKFMVDFKELNELKIAGGYLWGNNFCGVRNIESLKILSLRTCSVFRDIFENAKFLTTLEELDVSSCKNLSVDIFINKNGTSNFPAIQVLKLDFLEYFTSDDIKNIVRGAHSLKALYLRYTKVGNETIDFIAKECPNLEILDLNHTKVSNVNSIITSCKSLKSLNLGYSKVDDEGIEGFKEQKTKLQYLNLEGCSVSNNGLQSVSYGCPDLTELSLRYVIQTDDKGIKYLSEGISCLRNLRVDGCERITALCLEFMSRWTKTLEKLNLEHCTSIKLSECQTSSFSFTALKRLYIDKFEIYDNDLNNFPKWFPSIGYLRLADCKGITEEGVNSIIKDLPGRSVDSFYESPSKKVSALIKNKS